MVKISRGVVALNMSVRSYRLDLCRSDIKSLFKQHENKSVMAGEQFVPHWIPHYLLIYHAFQLHIPVYIFHEESKSFIKLSASQTFFLLLKAILQVLIYKALYDKSYLGSKTTMTSGEWTCLISFATAPLTCSEREGSEKIKMKIYVSSGIRTHTPPVHDRKVAAP